MGNGTFRDYLRDTNEHCARLEDHLDGGAGAPLCHLADFVAEDGTVLAWPEEIVFKERESTLVGADGKRVVGW